MACSIPYIRQTSFSDAEKSRLEDIHISVFEQARDSKLFREIDNKYQTIKSKYAQATEFVGKINTQFGKPISRIQPIGNGNSVLSVDVLPLTSEQLFLQKPGVSEPLKASPKTIKLVKDLIERMGVKYDGGVNNIVVNGEKIDANGIANIMKGYIEVIDGKESEALPEEAMHFAVEIIEQKNPKLFNRMLSEINSFQIYNEVLRDYSNDPLYQTRDGKPDIRKIKKEAIAKQLVNTIINKVESGGETYQNVAKAQTWWNQILTYIKSLFAKSGFDQAALDIISGKEIGTVDDIRKFDVLLPIGTSGSGKSTFIKSLPQENLVIIEPDVMRVEFTGNINDKSRDKEIYEEAAQRAIQAIKNGKQVVFDTTNLTKDKRMPFIEAIKKVLPSANIQYKLMELNPELAKQRIKAQIIKGENRANVPDSTIDRHAESYKQMLEDIKNEPITNYEISYLQLDKQGSLISSLKEVSSKIEKNDQGYFIDGKRIPRVTETIKTWADRMFEDRKLTQSEYDKLVDTLKQEKGTAGHKDLENAFSVFVGEDGYLREEPLDDSAYVSEINPENKDMYELLKANMKDRLESYPAGTRFLSEMTIYNPQRNLAGTVDFLAITPEGKVDILDWKFMALSDGYDDVPWYSVRSWNDQMNQYKLILEKGYNVNIKDFDKTRMIPIKAKYSKGDKKKNVLPKLLEIKIGDVNVKNIEQDYLLPVPLEGEKTGNKKIDALLEKLNALYKQFSDKAVVPSKKLEKAEQLNALFKAIRQLQLKENIKPLIYQAKILNKQLKDIISDYNTEWANVDISQVSQGKISAFQEEIESGLNVIQYYTTLDTELKQLAADDAELKSDLRDTVDDARDLNFELEEISREFADKFIAGSEQIKGSILSPEKVIKGVTRWFASTSNLQMKSMEVLFKKANKQLGYAGQDILEETKKLQTLKENYDQWAKSRGLTNATYFDLIKKKDKNELINEYNTEFYKELKAKITEKDYKWIQENINVSEYKKYLAKKLEDNIQRIKDRPRIGTEQEIDQQISFEISNAKNLYDVSTIVSVGWLLNNEVRKFPASKWETAEWKELHKKGNEPALAFFNYIKDRNEVYKELGYISEKNARVFLPFVRKGVVEKAVLGGDIRFGEHFLRAISIDEGDIGYGKIDPLTGQPVDSLPKYFTRDIDGEVSSDLFRTMALYNEAAIRYQYLKDIEAQARALIRIEKNKKSILTSGFGKTIYKDGELQYNPNNVENTKLLEDMVKGIIYGQKYIQSETFDQTVRNLGKFGEKANEKLGMKIFPENLENRQISVNKLLTQLNTTFQLNALGLNPLSALSNLLGGTFNSIINSGTYFTKEDFMAAEFNLTVNKFNGQDAKKMIGLLEYFLPLTDNYNQQLAKDLSLNKFSQENLQEFLMVLMRKSDWFVQTANFYAYLKNSIVQDGQVLNARVYLKSQPEYQDMYAGTKADRKAKKAKFEQEVDKLIKEKGVIKHSKIVDNQLVIEGLNKKDPSVLDVRKKVQFLNKSALGNLSDDDLRTINMNIYGKSFMLFKNWMPRLVDVRFGNLKYNSASDAYEWGRMRMVYRLLFKDLTNTLDSLKDSMIGSGDKWISQIKDMYEKKKQEYQEDTGKELEMTEAEFIELVQRNVKNQLKDSIIMLSLFGLFIGLGAMAPDDEEDEGVRNMHKYLLRATDKVRDELLFFYDPTSLTSLVGSGIFPSLAYINTLKRAISKFGIEVYGLSIGNDELVEDNDAIKYIMKSFPITNQGTQILPLFYPELAKDLGLRTTTQSRPIGF